MTRSTIAPALPMPSLVDQARFVLLGGGAAFAAYFSMYAFRKPFTAATYGDVDGWHFALNFKIALVIAQILGYTLSKFMGVKIVSEMAPARRGAAIVGLIGLAWFALILFAVLPPLGKVGAIFLNGIPLGMIWGLVFGYVEGRRSSELMAAMLCAALIISSGMVKSVGALLIAQYGVSAFWMPAATGVLFMPLLLISVYGLSRLPPPDAQDVAARVARPPIDGAGRRAFLRTYGAGVALLVLAYILFTALRDFRDNFAAEIWIALGYKNAAGLFTASELPIAIITLIMLASLVRITDNRRALIAMHAIVLAGGLMIGLSTLAFQLGLLSPLAWMIGSGLGLYFAYTPFNAMLFDRLIAATGKVGTAAFLIYIADASGYVGSVGLLLLRNVPGLNLPWLPFYIMLTYVASIASVMLMLGSALYWWRRLQHTPSVG